MRWSRIGLARRALLVAVLTVNLILVLVTIAGFFLADPGYDWMIYVEAGRRVFTGDLYAWSGDYSWIYSPLTAYVFAFVVPIGYWGWTALHFAALGLLREKRLILVAAVSFPFWVDIYNGNTLTFVVVAAVAALRGTGWGVGAYLLLVLMMPRPLMLPLAIWLLWRRPAWRVRFAVMVLIVAALVWASGYSGDWLVALIGVSAFVDQSQRDIGPSNLLGSVWPAMGAVLAVLLTVRGRLGWASLAASPYWLPHYLLMLLLELRSDRTFGGSGTPSEDG